MATFPTTEADVIALAVAMVAGYQDNPTVFPHADAVTLLAVRLAHAARRVESIMYTAFAKVKTAEKDAAFAALVDKMQLELKQSEVDTAGNSVDLALIGWGEKATASPTAPPGQPRSLDAARQGELGTLGLDWKAPAPGEGGPVRIYVIERRDGDPVKGFATWHQCGASFGTKTELLDQPQRQQLEYRVKAVNSAGESIPSNTVPVVL